MEDKDLQTGNSQPDELIVEAETTPAEEPAQAFEMFASDAPDAAETPVTETPVTEDPVPPSPVTGPVKEKKAARVSGFMRRGGLFEGYEVNNAKEMPFFMRVFAASALFHLVVIASALQLPAVVQTTCETTEFTQQLCDTMYVASLLSNSAGRDFVDEPYDPTEIPNAEDVTFITADSFQYPEGYWTLQDEINGIDPSLMVLNPTLSDVNGFNTGSPTTLDLNAPVTLPSPNSGAVSGGDINSPFSVGGSPNAVNPSAGRSSGKRIKTPPLGGGSPSALPELDDAAEPTTNAKPGKKNTTAKNQKPLVPETTGPKEDVYNKRPLYDFRDWLVGWRQDANNNFEKKFEYSIAGKVDKDGKLIFDGVPTFAGEPQMKDLVEKGVESFSSSGMLKLLTDLQSKNVKITFVQDGNQFNIKLESVQESERMANRLYFGINGAITLGKMAVEAGIIKEADPKNKAKEQATLDLLNMAKLRREGNTIIIDTAVPNKFAEDMYQTYKKDLEEKKSKPTGLAGNANENVNGSK